MNAPSSRRLRTVPVGLVLAATAVGLTGCADEGEDLAAGMAVDVPDIRGPDDFRDPYTGALDEGFREDLDVYSGVEVTVLATVEEVLSPRTFTATAPDGSEIEPVLVVTTGDAAGTEPEVGEDWVIAATPIEGFDAGTVAEELGISLPDDQYEEWDDEAFLVATVLEQAE